MIYQQLLASSGSLDHIAKIISTYFYGSTVILDKIDSDVWQVSTGKGVTRYLVLRKKNRYLFVLP
jgi:hypothetical protein